MTTPQTPSTQTTTAQTPTGQTTLVAPTPQPRLLYSTWSPGYVPQRPEATDADLDAAADLLRGHAVVALTGAGVSTESGLPDYRGPDAAPRRPMTYQQFVSDPGFRRHYWARNLVGWHHLTAAHPNESHRALADMERDGVVTGLITQNVDELHTRAGSRNVIDLHGTGSRVVCLTCGRLEDRAHLGARLREVNATFLARVEELGDIEVAPDADAVVEQTADFRVLGCQHCGGVLKPHIVYFGENVPKERVAASYEMVDGAGALIAAGTTLAVQSGLRLVKRAHRAGKPVVIVNRGVTRGDEFATTLLHAGTSRALRHLQRALAPVA